MLQLTHDLRGQAETARSVLTVDDGQVSLNLVLQPGKDGFDRVATRMADDIGHEQDAKVVGHQTNLQGWQPGVPAKSKILWGGNRIRNSSLKPRQRLAGKQKGEPVLGSPWFYLAYSTARVSRTTVTRIWPGKLSSLSIRLAMSRAISWAAVSSICSGLTRMRTSRPAWIAYDCCTPWKEFAISSSFSKRLT